MSSNKNTNLDFNKNEDFNKTMLDKLRFKLAKVEEGGGKKRTEKHKSKGKMLARERISYLLDKEKPSIEIGALTADGMYCV